MNYLRKFIKKNSLEYSLLTSGKKATIALDGWSNLVNNPVIGVVVIVRDCPPIFTRAIDTQGTLFNNRLNINNCPVLIIFKKFLCELTLVILNNQKSIILN